MTQPRNHKGNYGPHGTPDHRKDKASGHGETGVQIAASLSGSRLVGLDGVDLGVNIERIEDGNAAAFRDGETAAICVAATIEEAAETAAQRMGYSFFKDAPGGELKKGLDAMPKMKLFIPMTKVDEEKRLVYGRITAEVEDKSGETMDYETSKPQFEKWSGEFSKATGGKSAGNLRVMHGNKVAGLFNQIVFDDDNKAVEGVAHVVDNDEWDKVLKGCYTGFSVGGDYVRRWKDDLGKTRFTAGPMEVSLVDNPCVHSATFEVVKAGGAHEMRKFADAVQEPVEETEEQKLEKRARELCKAAGADPEEVLVEANEATKTPRVLKWHGFVEDARREAAPDTGPVQKWTTPDGKQFDKKADANAHMAQQAALKAAGALADPVSQTLEKLNKALDNIEAKSGENEDTGANTPAKEEDVFLKALRTVEEAAPADFAALAKALGMDETLLSYALAAPAVREFLKTNTPNIAKVVAASDANANGLQDEQEEDEPEAEEHEEALEDSEADGGDDAKMNADVDEAVATAENSGNEEDKTKAIDKAKQFGKMDRLPADWEGSTLAKGEVHPVLAKSLSHVGRLAGLLNDLHYLKVNSPYDCYPSYYGSTPIQLPEEYDEALDMIGKVLIQLTENEVAYAAKKPEVTAKAAGVLAAAAPVGLGVLAKYFGTTKMKKSHSAASTLITGAVSEAEKLAKKASGDGADEAVVAERDALRKQVGTLDSELTKVLARVEKLEAQPVAAKGFKRVLTKRGDGEGDDSGDGSKDPIDMMANQLRGKSPEETAMIMMKVAMRNGQSVE